MSSRDEEVLNENGGSKERVKTGLSEKRPSLDEVIRERVLAVKKGIEKTEGLAKALDKKMLDPLIGLLFPEAGDLVTGGLALWIVIEAKRAGLPNKKIARMLFNIGFDVGVGMIPAVGDIADFIIHSNTWNVNIMKDYLSELNAKHKEITGMTAEEALALMQRQAKQKRTSSADSRVASEAPPPA